MTPDAREVLGKLLSDAFFARGMINNIPPLRAWQHYSRRNALLPTGCWDDTMVVRWAAILQLPGYEAALGVRRYDSRCEACPGDPPAITRLAFDGGQVVGCSECCVEWLVLDKVGLTG